MKTTLRQRGSSCTFIFKFETMKKVFIAGSGEDPTFDLPIENELLMLKLKAEFGAECSTGSEEIPPAVVNEFLKSVYEFETKFREPRPMVAEAICPATSGARKIEDCTAQTFRPAALSVEAPTRNRIS